MRQVSLNPFSKIKEKGVPDLLTLFDNTAPPSPKAVNIMEILISIWLGGTALIQNKYIQSYYGGYEA